MALLIKNGRIIDPASKRDETADLLVERGRIRAIGPNLPEQGFRVLDATGKIIAPGFIDMHVHLREPGREDKETIASGTRAAAAGGFTTVCPMPNTTPPCDSAQGIQFLRSRAEATAVVNVLPVAAVTKGQEGLEICEYGDLVHYGAVAFSDDGHPIMNSEIMRRALEYTSMFDVPVLDHCEDLNLSSGGQMRSGPVAMRMGLKGVPYVANSSQVARDMDMALYTGGRVHICHVADRQSVVYIRTAKEQGVNVTCEVAPHHLVLTEDALLNYDTNFKMNPPLGSEEARQAVLEGLRSGAIDCIATDHAPHTEMEKDQVFADSPNGVIGMETAFPVLYTDLVLKNEIALPFLIEKMTIAPARILRQNKGTLDIDADADITILDLNLEKTVRADSFFSKSRNCPFIGRTLKGWPIVTIVGGEIVFENGCIPRDEV